MRSRRFPEAKEGFEILFSLLHKIDESPDDIIFFADEAGEWQVGVEWEKVLAQAEKDFPADTQALAELGL